MMKNIYPKHWIAGLFMLCLPGFLLAQTSAGITAPCAEPLPTPTLIEGPDTLCLGAPEEFTALPTLPGTLLEWEVTGGTVSPAFGPQTTVTLSGAGPYELRVRRVNQADPNCHSAWLTKTLHTPIVIPNITGPDQVCASTYETYLSGYPNGEYYEWSITPGALGSVAQGDGTQQVEVLWNHVTTPTFATLTVEVRKCGVYVSDHFVVEILPAPQLTIVAPDTVCQGEPVSFSFLANPSLGAGATIVWDFGNGNDTIAAAPTYSYENLINGNVTYTVGLSVSGGANCPGLSTASHEIVVKPAPVANLSPPGAFIACGTVPTQLLTATAQSGFGPIAQYEWFQNGASIVGPCPTCDTYTPTAFGNYYVVVTGTNGCTDQTNTVSFIENCGPASCTPIGTPVLSISGGLTDCGKVELSGSHSTGGSSPGWLYPAQASVTISGGGNDLEALFTEAGNYLFTYQVSYPAVGGGVCIIEEQISVIVPFVADLKYGVTCVSGGYQIELLDHSNFFPTTPITNYAFFQGTTLLSTGTVTTVLTGTLAPGIHDFSLVISDGIHPNCTTELQVDLPDLPVANFSFADDFACEKTPVFFTNASSGADSYFWDFGDLAANTQTDPERVFENSGSPMVTLTASNSVGCSDQNTQQVNITPNELGGLLSASPTAPCRGTPVTLSYVPNTFSGTPTLYEWRKSTDVLTTTTLPSYNVFDPGGYWALVKNDQGCRLLTTPFTPVSFTEVPLPVISGRKQQCAFQPFVLEGYAGPGIDDYAWYRNGNLLGSGAALTQWSEAGLAPGSYDYELVLEKDGCTRSSAIFTVTVSPQPTVVIDPLQVIDCASYTLLLEADGSPAGGHYVWSHGAMGQSVAINQGGAYGVIYTAPSGCVASAETYVPRDPTAYLWIFPEGCYRYCKDQLPVSLPGPAAPFSEWAWWKDLAIDLAGTGFVSDYSVANVGTYGLSLDNGLCDRMSEPMFVEVDEECGPCGDEDSYYEFSEFYQVGCTYHIDLVLYHLAGGGNASFTAQVSAGTVTPVGGTFAGSGSLVSFVIQAPSPWFGGTVTLTLYVTLPNGKKCILEVPIYVERCSGDSFGRLADPGKEGTDATTSYLHLHPNPSTGIVWIDYALPPSKGTGGSLSIYDSRGQIIREVVLQENSGNWKVNCSDLPEGLYLIVLRQGKQVLEHRKLSIHR